MKTTKTIWMISRQALFVSTAAMVLSAPVAGSRPAEADTSASVDTAQLAVPVIRTVTYNGHRATTPASLDALVQVDVPAPVASNLPSKATLEAKPRVKLASAEVPLAASTAVGDPNDSSMVPPQAPVDNSGLSPEALKASQDSPSALPPDQRPANAPVVSDQGTDVQIDFVDASIVDVLKALAMQSGANIVTSPDVTGKVTVTLTHVSLESALDYVAKLAGYSWIKDGNTYVVGTDKSLAPFKATPVADTARITKTVEFQNADPDDLLASIKATYPDVSIALIKPGADVSTAASAQGTQTTSVREKGGILMVTGLADQVEAVQSFVTLAEATFHPDIQTSETSTYRVKYAYLPNLMSVLAELVPKLNVITGPSQQFETGGHITFTSDDNNETDRFTNPAGAPAGNTGSGPIGTVDKNLSAPTLLILTGTKDDITRALDILSKIDIKPTQLLFEAKVAEISENDEHDLGLNWDFTGATTTIGEAGSGTQPFKQFGAITRTPLSNFANVSLNALFTNGAATLLAKPDVAALDGQRASIFIGNTVNYVSSISQTTTGEDVTTASVKVGVILGLTGRSSGDGYITLYLHPEVSSITNFLTVPGGGELPQLANRFIDTVIRVKDGDTIAIGGLIQTNDLSTVNKVPGLGDIPVFGSLFRDVKKTKERDEVIFFIKTSLIQDQT